MDLKSAWILLLAAWLAAPALPRCAQAEETGRIIRGVSAAGMLDGGQARIYREKKSRQKKAVAGFISFLPGYIAVFLGAAGLLFLIKKRIKQARLNASARQGLEAAIKSKIRALALEQTAEKADLGPVGVMFRQHLRLGGDPRVFDTDELPYIAASAVDLASLTQLLTTMSGAGRLRLAKKLFELEEPRKSVNILNAAAISAADSVEGGPEAVILIYDAAGRLDEFIGRYCKALPPKAYSAYAGALMKLNKNSQALRLLKLSQKPPASDLPLIFELHVRLGGFSQAEALLTEVSRIKPVQRGQAAVEENQKFYYSLALVCEEKGAKELARRIYKLFMDTGQQYRTVTENYNNLAKVADQAAIAERKQAPAPVAEPVPSPAPALSDRLAREEYVAQMYREEKAREREREEMIKRADVGKMERPAPGTIPPVPSPSLKKGRLDGKYELKGEIGAGGMGIVYEGWDHSLGRKVAIKKMRSELKAYPKERERFLREAAMVARLTHPYIVGIHAIIEENGEVYLVFDYIEGKTLSAVIAEKGQLPLKDCKSILGYVCLAVNYAHQQKIIHRDLKPANIIVDTNNFAKVMDFGLSSELGDSLTRLTRQTVVGTPIYMAPEQYRGITRPETDIYALGICFYEMLTGDVPFSGMDTQAAKDRKDYKDVSLILPWLPGEVDKVISKALESDPRERFGDAMRFYQAIDSL
ncbi:MAG: hypothetical protein COT18_08260 [Elusimicrobia bacterium CG08_land_8_20_14_0_20_59_10]|nr:MAG: hypothetical protein COT18_08260 [Elusimicrobia bacterium CG08_land_8_20_14_0_20_59_10]